MIFLIPIVKLFAVLFILLAIVSFLSRRGWLEYPKIKK